MLDGLDTRELQLVERRSRTEHSGDPCSTPPPLGIHFVPRGESGAEEGDRTTPEPALPTAVGIDVGSLLQNPYCGTRVADDQDVIGAQVESKDVAQLLRSCEQDIGTGTAQER